MTVTEKVAYLKGLAKGLDLAQDKAETKMFDAIMEVLEDMALTVSDLEDEVAELGEQIDAVDEDLADVEELVFGDYDDECDCCGDEDEEAYYDVCCPNCNEEFCVDEETLLEGGIECPGCGEHLEFGDIECDDECGCGCHDHDHTDE